MSHARSGTDQERGQMCFTLTVTVSVHVQLLQLRCAAAAVDKASQTMLRIHLLYLIFFQSERKVCNLRLARKE